MAEPKTSVMRWMSRGFLGSSSGNSEAGCDTRPEEPPTKASRASEAAGPLLDRDKESNDAAIPFKSDGPREGGSDVGARTSDGALDGADDAGPLLPDVPRGDISDSGALMSEAGGAELFEPVALKGRACVSIADGTVTCTTAGAGGSGSAGSSAASKSSK